MKQNSKGIAHVIVLILVLLVAIGAIGYLAFGSKNNTASLSPTSSPSPTTKDTPSPVPKKIRVSSLPVNYYINQIFIANRYLYALGSRGLYFTKIVDGQVLDEFMEVSNLPMSDSSYLMTNIVNVGDFVYVFGFRRLSPPKTEGFASYASQADIYKGEITPDGNVGNWKKLDVVSPSVGLINAGLIVKAHRNYLYMINSVDDYEYPVYKALVKEKGDLEKWEKIDPLPQAVVDAYLGTPDYYLFSEGRLYITQSENRLLEYEVLSDGDLLLKSEKEMVLPTWRLSNLAGREHSLFIQDEVMFYMEPGRNETEKLLKLDVASLEEEKVVFKQFVNISTDVDTQQILSVHDADNIYIIVTDLESGNKVSEREIIVVPLGS